LKSSHRYLLLMNLILLKMW